MPVSTSIEQEGIVISPLLAQRGGALTEAARALFDELGMTSYPKTTGNRGLHVYVRLRPQWDSYVVRSAAVLPARMRFSIRRR